MKYTAAFILFASLAAAAPPQAAPATSAVTSLRSTYVLGPDDQIALRALDAPEISDKPVRVDMSGHIRMPMVGRIKASGLTVEQLETEIAARLAEYLKEPEVAVSIVEFRSQPVSIIGAVKNPGVHQLQGRKTLVEILSMAGGLSDDAGHSIKITRRHEWGPIPLKSAQDDPTGKFSLADVDLKAIMEARNPEENIIICPQDVISVPRADMIYVIGQVQRSGGFVLKERETISVLQALSLAGGLDRAASPQNARILRPAAGTAARDEIPVNVRKIMSGQLSDVPLKSEDILFIPDNLPKKAIARAAEAAIQIGTGVVIWRR
ncbi:MAG: polysaccharide biosynthesis/export family protein [Bryobacterales bacterium]|nr:polysaccharide biosynthesis/export family protein [Bryobacterales bacterium]